MRIARILTFAERTELLELGVITDVMLDRGTNPFPLQTRDVGHGQASGQRNFFLHGHLTEQVFKQRFNKRQGALIRVKEILPLTCFPG